MDLLDVVALRNSEPDQYLGIYMSTGYTSSNLKGSLGSCE
jgi:hypothetical protein